MKILVLILIQGWYIERITANFTDNYAPSLTLSQGTVYMVYPDGDFPSSGTIHLRIGNISNWWDTVLYTCSYDFPWLPAIQIDHNNKLHIIFSLAITSGLWYATNASGSWQISPLSFASDGEWPQFVLDRGNNIHLVYAIPFSGGIYYANNVGGNWEIKWNCNFGFYPSIALDSLGHVHIVFDGYNGGGGLYYVTNSSGQWTMEQIIPPYCSRLAATDIKIDYMQNIHVTYRANHESGSPIYYALGYSNNIGGWNYIELDSMIRHDSRPSLVVDKFGNVHIAYTKLPGPEIYYITNKNGVWEKFPVTSNSYWDEIYWIPSFEIDSIGYGHIVWNGYPDGVEDVFYAISDSALVKIKEKVNFSFLEKSNFFPTSNIFYKRISFLNSQKENLPFEIFTLSGRKMEISCKNFDIKNGIYFLKEKEGNKKFKIVKF
jgi:hypothetical protein